MTTAGSVLRWLHVLAGSAWLGAVAVVVLVLVPSLHQLEEPRRGWFAQTVFPKIFRLASILSVTAVTTGLGLYFERFGWRLQLEPLVTTRWGWAILIGSTLALILTAFHFLAEGRLAPYVKGAGTTPVERGVLSVLRIAPRIGLTVLVAVMISMAYAARGL